MAKLHILHLTLRYWPAYGGAEKHLQALSERFAADGHQVTVATTDAFDFELLWEPDRRRVERPVEAHNEVHIIRFPMRHLPLTNLAYPGWRRFLWILSHVRPVPTVLIDYLSRFTPWVPELWRWAAHSAEGFDIVGGMNICFEPILSAGLRVARRLGVPFVSYPITHLGAGPHPGEDALSRFYTMRHQVALVRASDAVVAQTPTEQDFYFEHNVPPERIAVVGAGVHPPDLVGGDGQRFRQCHHLTGPLVSSISSMAYDKGTVHLVEAMRYLWQQGRDLDLVLAGAVMIPFRRYLAGLPAIDRERIHIFDLIDEAAKKDLLAATDVFAMPSRTDSFGIVYLEAWLYGKPVIGARAWGVADVINDGQDGLLVPFGDVSALAQAIARLLDDPAERIAMGARGQQKVYRSHTWDHKYTLVRDVYQQALARHSRK